LKVATWRKLNTKPPTKRISEDEKPANNVSFQNAVEIAELLGKRLITEFEYEALATNGGKTKYPTGNETPTWLNPSLSEPDLIQKFYQAAQSLDRTPTDPPVYGLYSGAPEWTDSTSYYYPGTKPTRMAGSEVSLEKVYSLSGKHRVIRGGVSVDPMNKTVDRKWLDYGLRYRYFFLIDRPIKTVGFRCGRSVKPRFLD